MRERLGRYLLCERIGGGGMAEVFAGELTGVEGFSRAVAIKRVRAELSQRPEFGRMFVREARIASLLSHPNIVSVIDFDRDQHGHYFLVMERIHGVDLRALAATGVMPVAIAVDIVAAVLRALSHAHEFVHEGRPLGIVHRDVSPHNVMLGWDGSVKLLDFGVARALAASSSALVGSVPSLDAVRGKVSYMSPEQAHGVQLDGRTDVFSAGVILHELLSGRRLFAAPSPVASLALLLRKRVPPLPDHVPASVALACRRMLARDRNQRFASAGQALHGLLQERDPAVDGAARLRAYLAARCPQRAPQSVASTTPLLSDQPVPMLPSLTLSEPRAGLALNPADANHGPLPASDVTIADAPTNTAPLWGSRAVRSPAVRGSSDLRSQTGPAPGARLRLWWLVSGLVALTALVLAAWLT